MIGEYINHITTILFVVLSVSIPATHHTCIEECAELLLSIHLQNQTDRAPGNKVESI